MGRVSAGEYFVKMRIQICSFSLESIYFFPDPYLSATSSRKLSCIPSNSTFNVWIICPEFIIFKGEICTFLHFVYLTSSEDSSISKVCGLLTITVSSSFHNNISTFLPGFNFHYIWSIFWCSFDHILIILCWTYGTSVFITTVAAAATTFLNSSILEPFTTVFTSKDAGLPLPVSFFLLRKDVGFPLPVSFFLVAVFTLVLPKTDFCGWVYRRPRTCFSSVVIFVLLLPLLFPNIFLRICR